MTVQQLIDELSEIKDKSLDVTIDGSYDVTHLAVRQDVDEAQNITDIYVEICYD